MCVRVSDKREHTCVQVCVCACVCVLVCACVSLRNKSILRPIASSLLFSCVCVCVCLCVWRGVLMSNKQEHGSTDLFVIVRLCVLAYVRTCVCVCL